VSPTHDYTVRESARAKRVSVRVSRRGEVEIVLPRGVDPRIAPRIVERHGEWIERRLARAERDQARLEPEPTDGRPTSIPLRALREELSVAYVPSHSSRLTTTEACSASSYRPDTLRLTGPVENTAACREALRRWLRKRAREYLIPRLDSLAAENGFGFARASIRLQRTRWGSCSSSGTISLNAKALFLPPELVDHLLLHELCHTEHKNHSEHFYSGLENHSADARKRERELRAAWFYVPRWADEKLPTSPG
jgi:predicted metal-dependent hydrolase